MARPRQSSEGGVLLENAVIAHEVQKIAVVFLGTEDVAEIGCDERPSLGGVMQPVGFDGNNERARVVVDTVTAPTRRYAVRGVLDNAGVVGHSEQMIEA